MKFKEYPSSQECVVDGCHNDWGVLLAPSTVEVTVGGSVWLALCIEHGQEVLGSGSAAMCTHDGTTAFFGADRNLYVLRGGEPQVKVWEPVK